MLLLAGFVGRAVAPTEPYPAYLVEFVDETGATKAEVALAPDELSGKSRFRGWRRAGVRR